MGTIVLTGTAGWQVPSAGFTNPQYVSGPAGQSDPSGSVGFDISSTEVVVIAFEGTYTGQTVVHEQTMDPSGVNGWFPVAGVQVDSSGTLGSGLSTSGVGYMFPATGVRHRVRVTALSTGTLVARISLTVQGVLTIAGGAGGGGSGASANQVQGNSASGAADLGNPVKIGGVYSTATSLAALTAGNRGDVQSDNFGNVRAVLTGSVAAAADGLSNNWSRVMSAASNALSNVGLLAVMPTTFNGTTWDRQVKANAVSRIPTSANTTNPTSAKGSAGNIFAITALNTTATITYLKIYNKATAPTVGTDTPVMTLPIPANGALVIDFANGYYLGTGIAYGVTTDAADGGSTAPAAAALVGLNVIYS